MTDSVARRTGSVYGRSPAELRSGFVDGAIPVAVYGLGKMGLPLASVFAETTGNVIGADINPDVVDTIQDGGCHVKREPGLDALVSDLVAEGSLRATTEPREAATEASVHVVIVPTPITDTNEPDLAILDTVVEDIGRGLQRGDLVLIECTVPPRTTEHRVLPALEDASRLERGEFGVAFCPERTASGRALEDIRGAYPKVVGGVDEASTTAATAIYEEINNQGVLPVSDPTTAESVKVFEGLYRDVNIALANELATFTDELGIEVREAIDVANTQPYCDIHDPGPGVGGHCIPYYPYFMIKPFETDAPILKTARSVNDSMPSYTVDKLREQITADARDLSASRVAILGLSYRADVAELRGSPALDIVDTLLEIGTEVVGVDPLITKADLEHERDMPILGLEDLYENRFDALVLVTPHSDFEDLQWQRCEPRSGQLIVIDGRGTLDLSDTDHRVYTIGGCHV